MQRIAIRPSAQIAIGLCVAHAAAAAVVWVSPISLEVKTAVTLAIAWSLVYGLVRKAALQAAEAVVALEVSEDGRISLQTRRGDWLDCEMLSSSYVSPRLTILNLKPAGARSTRHVLLVPDNVDAQDFRRLRTWLRWAATAEAPRS